MSPLLIALAAMFFQQTFASVGTVLPAVVAPLVIAELQVDAAWVGVERGQGVYVEERHPIDGIRAMSGRTEGVMVVAKGSSLIGLIEITYDRTPEMR